MCTVCIPSAHGGRKRVSEPLEPELQMMVSLDPLDEHPVSALNPELTFQPNPLQAYS